MKVVSPIAAEELLAAPMAGLAASPATQEAHLLVDHIVALILAHEKRTGARQRMRRQDDQISLSRAVAAFLADLLVHAPREGRGAVVYRSLNANSFSGSPVHYRQFKAAVDALVALKLVERFDGFYEAKAFEWGDGVVSGRGRASRFRATPTLLRIAAEYGVAAGASRDHFRQPPPDRVIVLKAKSGRVGRRKIRGRDLEVPETPEVRRLSDQVRAIDAFLREVKITGGSHQSFFRSFEHGDQPEFRWNKGGRLYSSGPGNYQTLKEADRLAMRFDGEAVVEIDIKASYLTILHGKLGISPKFGADPYAVPGIPREVVKGWLVATLGAEKHLQRWPQDQAAEYAEAMGGRLGRDYPISVVREKMLARYPVLRHVGEPGLGWADLMFAESEAIIRTILFLVEQRTPSLPVHDSLIVPASAEGLCVAALRKTFDEVVGVEPLVEVNRGGTHTSASPTSYGTAQVN